MLETRVKILWKPVDATQNTRFIRDGWSIPYRIGTVAIRAGSRVHEDLEKLALYLRTGDRRDRQWSVVPLECVPDDYEPEPILGQGWYKARRDIIPQNHFRPLSDAEEMYLNTKQDTSEPNLDIPLDKLPWPKSQSSTLAMHAFSNYFRRMPSAREVHDLIIGAGGNHFHLKGFGRGAADAIREAYRSIGIQIAPYDYSKMQFLTL